MIRREKEEKEEELSRVVALARIKIEIVFDRSLETYNYCWLEVWHHRETEEKKKEKEQHIFYVYLK